MHIFILAVSLAPLHCGIRDMSRTPAPTPFFLRPRAQGLRRRPRRVTPPDEIAEGTRGPGGRHLPEAVRPRRTAALAALSGEGPAQTAQRHQAEQDRRENPPDRAPAACIPLMQPVPELVLLLIPALLLWRHIRTRYGQNTTEPSRENCHFFGTISPLVRRPAAS